VRTHTYVTALDRHSRCIQSGAADADITNSFHDIINSIQDIMN